jgi:hypothetical protein
VQIILVETSRALQVDVICKCRKKLDLGQFERFKRVFFTPWFQPLIGHTSVSILSRLPVSDDVWKSRLLVQHGQDGSDHATYEVTLRRDKAGVHKGMWMTESLKRDDHEGLRSCL